MSPVRTRTARASAKRAVSLNKPDEPDEPRVLLVVALERNTAKDRAHCAAVGERIGVDVSIAPDGIPLFVDASHTLTHALRVALLCSVEH